MKSEKAIDYYKQKIEQLSAEVELKTKWISLLAHDFKGLSSNINLLLNAMAEQHITYEVFMSMLPELKQLAAKNYKTIESTLAWVNAQSDGFNPANESINLHVLFSQLIEEYAEAIATKNLSFQFEGDETIKLNTDPFLLRFILKQLVENAIKYSNKSCTIVLQTHTNNDKVHIVVKDSGVGMNHSRLGTIGTLDGVPYTGTMDEKGAGLSLVIVNDFVELLGGTMRVESVEGEGTMVKLQFPWVE